MAYWPFQGSRGRSPHRFTMLHWLLGDVGRLVGLRWKGWKSGWHDAGLLALLQVSPRWEGGGMKDCLAQELVLQALDCQMSRDRHLSREWSVQWGWGAGLCWRRCSPG